MLVSMEKKIDFSDKKHENRDLQSKIIYQLKQNDSF